MRRVNRRDILKFGGAAGAGLAFGPRPAFTAAQSQRLSVLTLQQPNLVPPGVGGLAQDLLDLWQQDHDTGVDYDERSFFEIDSAIEEAFSSGASVRDVFYNWATIPEIAGNLVELGSRLPTELIDDLAPSQAASVSWQGQQYGIMPTLAPMMLYYNRDLFQGAGIDAPPATWDELKSFTSVFGGDAPYGLVMPYGAPAGIGGVASVWMAFLQQAGGRMYDDAGQPVFDDAPGVDALQFMIDLLPLTTGESLGLMSYADAASRVANRTTAMTFTFPAFWSVLNGGAPPGEGFVIPAVMPKGPESNATITGVDAWTIATMSPNIDLSQQLLEFYLSPDVQKRQAIDTGWLPARLSVLGDPDVQAANPMAAVVLEQVKSPFESFVTPNYMAITNLIGREIQKALRGEQSASQALTAAKSAIQPLLA